MIIALIGMASIDRILHLNSWGSFFQPNRKNDIHSDGCIARIPSKVFQKRDGNPKIVSREQGMIARGNRGATGSHLDVPCTSVAGPTTISCCFSHVKLSLAFIWYYLFDGYSGVAVPGAILSLISSLMLRKCRRGRLNYALADSRATGLLLNAILYLLLWIELLRTRYNPNDDTLMQTFRLLDHIFAKLCS
jgi:hypothetical protein